MNASFITSVLRGRSSALMALAMAATVATTTSAFAAAISITPTPTTNNDGPGKTYSSFELGQGFGTVAGWTNASGAYNFVFSSASNAVSPGGVSTSISPLGVNTVQLWSVQTPPVAGAFFGLDTDFSSGALTADLGALTAGTYTVTFDFAAAQQNNYSGESWDQLEVSLDGSPVQTTAELLDASESSTPWVAESFTFTVGADSNAMLSFLGVGGQCLANNGTICTDKGSSNVPAFALLDDVSITSTTPSPTPEPSSLLLMGTGLAGLAGFVRSRFNKTADVSL